MGSTALLVTYGAVLAACVIALCAVLTVLLTASARRTARKRRDRLEEELTRSRADVEALAQRVDVLGREVVAARREYVITSLGDRDDAPAGTPPRPGPRVGELVEDRLVRSLARSDGGSGVRGRAADLVVRTVAVGHGVRRAMSPEVLDRAAATAQVARRRSRRDRRRELRDARRLLRAVRATEQRQQTTGRDDRGQDEDAA